MDFRGSTVWRCMLELMWLDREDSNRPSGRENKVLFVELVCTWAYMVKGELYTPNEKLACLALYLKIVNTFVQNTNYPRNSKMALKF